MTERSPAVLPRRPLRARLGYVLYLVAAVLLLLEVVLQIGSFIAWQGASRRFEQAAGKTEDTILCVGDSWTQGVGSSNPEDHSYPAVAGRILAHHDSQAALDFVNHGLSGQNSRDVLGRLQRALTTLRPQLVLVLVGQNDFWSQPTRWEAGDAVTDPSAFRWRWRIPRLLLWLTGKFTGAGQVDDARGDIDFDGPEWRPRRVTRPHPYPRPDAAWARDRESQRMVDDANRLIASRRFAEARQRLDAALARQPDDPRALGAAVTLGVRSADPAAVDSHLAKLAELHAHTAEPWTAAEFVAALDTASRFEEGIAYSTDLVERFPRSAKIWAAHARLQFALGAVDAACASMQRAIKYGATLGYYSSLARFQTAGLGDIPSGVATLIRGYLEFNSGEQLLGQLRALPGDVEATYRRAVAVCDGTDAQRRRLEVIGDAAFRENAPEIGAVLEHNLSQIVSMCRSAGARPVLLTYPQHGPSREIQRRTRAATGAAWIDVGGYFVGVMSKRSWESLRAPDGHCNDDGYREMGRYVANGLLHLLEAQPPRSDLLGRWMILQSAEIAAFSDDGRAEFLGRRVQWRLQGDRLIIEEPTGTILEATCRPTSDGFEVDFDAGVRLTLIAWELRDR